jgi:DNA/RNA endonuclease YhcR with UshA esterase domain
VMHGKNPIEKDIFSSIFSIESLIKFHRSLEILKYYNSKLEELIYTNEDYQLSVKLENQNKLKIIHEHHPRALKYFIGY